MTRIRGKTATEETPAPATRREEDTEVSERRPKPREIGGPRGLEPTRYGDWERRGRCIDF